MISVRHSFDAYLDEYYGLSTDAKPTSEDVINGSSFVEMDTGKKYLYDAGGKEWHETAANSFGDGAVSGGGAASGNSDYSVTSERVVLFEGDIDAEEEYNSTFWANLEQVDLTGIETIFVTLDGETYEVNAQYSQGDLYFGELDQYGDNTFTNYPFIIWNGNESENYPTNIGTPTQSYSLKIEAARDIVTVTDDFKAAVDSVTGYSINAGGRNVILNDDITLSSNGNFYGAPLNIIDLSDYDVIYVTVDNGETFRLEKHNSNVQPTKYFGELGAEGPDLTNYPVVIAYTSNMWGVFTDTDSCHLKIEVDGGTSVTLSDEFKEAVSSVQNILIVNIVDNDGILSLDKTAVEIKEAAEKGMVIVKGVDLTGQYPEVRFSFPEEIDFSNDGVSVIMDSTNHIAYVGLTDSAYPTLRNIAEAIDPGNMNPV